MINPMTAFAVGGGLLRGITSLFGESEEEKRNKQRRRAIQILREQMQRNEQKAEEDKAQTTRMFQGEKADRRNLLTQKLSQYGMDPTGSMAANEKDLVEGEIVSRANIDSQLKELNNAIQSQIGEIESGIETEESGFSRFLGEGIEGVNMGINFGKAFGFMDPAAAITGGDKTGTPITGEDINPTADSNFELKLNPGGDKTTFGSGDLLGLGDADSGMNLLNYSDLMSNYLPKKKTFKMFNNIYKP